MDPTSLIAAGPIAEKLFGLVDELFTSEEERMVAKIRVLELEKAGELAQIGVNTREASHTSLFVAGWRPYIGWVCGLAFTWAFLVFPFLSFVMFVLDVPVDLTILPQPDMSEMMPVLLGMLGLGAMRTYEKQHGVARNSHTESDGVDRRANA